MRKACQVNAQSVPGPFAKRARSIRKRCEVHSQKGGLFIRKGGSEWPS